MDHQPRSSHVEDCRDAPVSKPARWTSRVSAVIVILFCWSTAPSSWCRGRIVTETMDRIGYGASESLARSLGVITVVCTVLYAIPPTSILGAILLTGYLGGAMASHVRIGSPLFSHILFGFYLGLMVWGGLWLRDRSLRIDAAVGADLPDQTSGNGELPCLKSLPSSPSCWRSPSRSFSILAATKPDTFSVQRGDQHAGAGRRNFSADQRFSSVGERGRPGRTRIPR